MNKDTVLFYTFHFQIFDIEFGLLETIRGELDVILQIFLLLHGQDAFAFHI